MKIETAILKTLSCLAIIASFSGVIAKDANTVKSKQATKAAPAKLVVPPVHYAVTGVEMEIIFSNAVLPEPKSPFRYSVKCDVGNVSGDRLMLNPDNGDVGDHALTVTLKNADGKKLAEASSIIRIMPKNAGAKKEISLLIMGDSLTNASVYPNEVARMLSELGNPKWKMLGTHHPKSAGEKVNHEGYGGWTWARFNSQWAPEVNQAGKTGSSPFLALGKDEKPVLDIGRYLIKNCGGKAPDYVTILLGINDCFHPNPDDTKAIEDRISLMIREAEKFLKAFRKESPDTEIGICLVPAGNSRDAAFEANYKGRYTRWGWRRIQYRLVERQLKQFGDREKENIFIIPTSLVVDSTLGYPDGNGVHPNKAGYGQIAGEIYAWLKWRMSK